MTLKTVLIGIAALVVLGGVGLFVLDQTVFAPVAVSTGVPVAPTLAAPTSAAQIATEPGSAATQTAATPAAVTAAVTADTAADTSSTVTAKLYRIDAAQSEVRYEVGETFFQGNRFATAIGRTKGVAGDVLIDFASPANSQIGQIVIDVSQFKSDESRRDNFIRRTGLESQRYPQATFVARELEGLPDRVAAGDQISFTIQGDLTVKETTRPVTWNATLKVEGSRVVGSASTQILLSDFGVGPIKIPLLETEDEVKLHFDFVALPAAA